MSLELLANTDSWLISNVRWLSEILTSWIIDKTPDPVTGLAILDRVFVRCCLTNDPGHIVLNF